VLEGSTCILHLFYLPPLITFDLNVGRFSANTTTFVYPAEIFPTREFNPPFFCSLGAPSHSPQTYSYPFVHVILIDEHRRAWFREWDISGWGQSKHACLCCVSLRYYHSLAHEN
jgi:hypothetical protein